jgi:hypothetical protein
VYLTILIFCQYIVSHCICLILQDFYIDLLFVEAVANSLEMANSVRSNQRWCSKCNAFRDEQSFEKHKCGKVKKLCNRHGRKRELDAIFDDWDEFEGRLVAWNHPVWQFSASLSILPSDSLVANISTFIGSNAAIGVRTYIQFR